MISCKEYAASKKEQLKKVINNLTQKPVLSIIQIGDNPASNSYVKGKIRDCEEVGIVARHIRRDETITQEELNELVRTETADESCTGCIVQLPLPKHLDENVLLDYIPKAKDVDGFRPSSPFIPCTPLGVLLYLKACGIHMEGKHCVVIGRSNIVGKPMAQLFLRENATVTICHSKTTNLQELTKLADIIVVAAGKRNILNGDMVKEGAVVVDVGINRNEEGKLCGDCDYDSLVEKCSLITPVPGGVGLLTRVTLLDNVLLAYTLSE